MRRRWRPPRGGWWGDTSPRREWVIDFGNGGCLALYRYDEDTDTVTVLTARHQREAGY